MTPVMIEVEGIPVEVVRKPIRNLYLRVKPPDGHVVLSVPLYLSQRQMHQFLLQRLDWIRQHQAGCAALPAAAQYLSGESHLLWGVPRRLQIAEAGKRASSFLDGDRIVLLIPLGGDLALRKRTLDLFYRQQLTRAIEALRPECEAIVGRTASAWRVRDMTSRWGSCNTATGAITLNLQLALRDPKYLRYVILHELTHLHERGHNARFYGLMDTFCPDWKALRKQLKQG